MAYVCVESIVMFFFLMLRGLGSYALDHWGFIISLLIIFFIISKFLPGWILGALGDAQDTLTDLVGDVLVETVIGTIILAGIGGIFTSIIWVLILITSKANFLLKILTAPFFFLVGGLVGVFPIPTPGLTLALGWGMDQETFADLFCLQPFIVLILLFIALKLIFGQDFCSFLNEILNTLT